MDIPLEEALRLAAALIGPKLMQSARSPTDPNIPKQLFELAKAIQDEGKAQPSSKATVAPVQN